MKKGYLIFSGILLSSLSLNGQFTPKLWILGQGSGGGVMFTNNAIAFTDTATFVQGLSGVYNVLSLNSAAIADAAHPILFYTNGVNIYNWQHNVIQDGDSLNPCPYTFNFMTVVGSGIPQIDIFIPDPGDTNKFYLFHASGDLYYSNYPGISGTDVPNKLYYTLIDKTLDSGNGGVVTKNNIIGNDTIGFGLLAVKHGNGRDWWIIARHNHRPRFYTWLLTPAGLSGPFMQVSGPIAYAGFFNFKFSLVANKLVGMRAWHTNDSMYVDLYDFDRCNGMINFSETLPISYNQIYAPPGGCEISPSGRYLYTGTMLELHQYDMLAPNLAASDIMIDDMPFDTSQACGCPYGLMQLGADGRIYIGSNFGSDFHLNVINYPDSAGLACNAVRHQVTFPAYHFQDLPNIPLYELGPLYGSACDSLSAGINDMQPQPQLIIYPNPAGTVINIGYAEPVNDFKVTVYDRLGKKVIAAHNQKAIDVSHLTAGVYVVEVLQKESIVRGKFLKE